MKQLYHHTDVRISRIFCLILNKISILLINKQNYRSRWCLHREIQLWNHEVCSQSKILGQLLTDNIGTLAVKQLQKSITSEHNSLTLTSSKYFIFCSLSIDWSTFQLNDKIKITYQSEVLTFGLFINYISSFLHKQCEM